MTDPVIEPGEERIDWRGLPIDCAACVHVDLRDAGGCRAGHACVEDRYARRIDRFFDWNPRLGSGYVTHPHFEVRAIAAKHAVRRLPMRYKKQLRADPHREVRIRIAAYLDDADLIPMMDDPDYYVRLVVARRIAPSLLGPLMHDEEVEVRRRVVARVAPSLLMAMVHDPDPSVRLGAIERMSRDLIAAHAGNSDWRIRHAVAARTPERAVLRRLRDDADPLVAEMAAERLALLCATVAEVAS
jgi:hypothetical protein